MLGIIVTGHGEFSQGLIKAYEMIAGKNEHVTNVLFKDGMDLLELQSELNAKISDFVTQYEGVVVLTDLKGGTPFNVSMMIASTMSNVAVLSGSNLPMVIEGALLGQFSDSVDELAAQLVQVGQAGIDRPILTVADTVEDDVFEDEDGI